MRHAVHTAILAVAYIWAAVAITLVAYTVLVLYRDGQEARRWEAAREHCLDQIPGYVDHIEYFAQVQECRWEYRYPRS
jgi:hypothetical protein